MLLVHILVYIITSSSLYSQHLVRLLFPYVKLPITYCTLLPPYLLSLIRFLVRHLAFAYIFEQLIQHLVIRFSSHFSINIFLALKALCQRLLASSLTTLPVTHELLAIMVIHISYLFSIIYQEQLNS